MENDTPGEKKGYFYIGLVTHSCNPKQLKKIPGASAGTGLGSRRRDLLEATLPLKVVFL